MNFKEVSKNRYLIDPSEINDEINAVIKLLGTNVKPISSTNDEELVLVIMQRIVVNKFLETHSPTDDEVNEFIFDNNNLSYTLTLTNRLVGATDGFVYGLLSE